MKIRTLFLGALMTGLAHTGAASADFTPIKMKLAEKGIGTIKVSGTHLDAYREVLTGTVAYSFLARGDTPASQGDTVPNFVIQAIEDGAWAAKYEGPLYEDWNKYGISFPYRDVLMAYSSKRLAPVKRCNERLARTTGAARKEFLYNGATIKVQNAYVFRGYVPKDGGGDVDVVYAPVMIECLPLDHNPVKATLRIEPAKVERVGKFLCPMELRLYGYVESREKFQGKALFMGPHYLSAMNVLNYATAGSRNIKATYKVKWKQVGGLTTAPNAEPKKQDLLFRFNVADQNGKLVRSPEKRVQVSCKKIKPNSAAIGGEMTTAPAN